MRLDLSTISRHLRSLEQQGMVQRTAGPDDARALRISITARGGDVINRVMDHRAATIRDAIVHWPEDDRRALRQLLCRLADDLSFAGPCASAASDEPARTEEMMEKS
jgi:DNA-binding MarR family transcriptional regulator